ncbi:MAG: hypothetical protein HC793_04035 [Aquincola sp.]|nr:hypothetical protein [Aquincola sp.]
MVTDIGFLTGPEELVAEPDVLAAGAAGWVEHSSAPEGLTAKEGDALNLGWLLEGCLRSA